MESSWEQIAADILAALPQGVGSFVDAIIDEGMTDQAYPPLAVFEISLQDLLLKLYPDERQPEPNEYWPSITQTVEILNNTWIQREDPENGKSRLRRIVNVSSIPRDPEALDDVIQIIIDIPTGLGFCHGPVVSPDTSHYYVH